MASTESPTSKIYHGFVPVEDVARPKDDSAAWEWTPPPVKTRVTHGGGADTQPRPHSTPPAQALETSTPAARAEPRAGEAQNPPRSHPEGPTSTPVLAVDPRTEEAKLLLKQGELARAVQLLNAAAADGCSEAMLQIGLVLRLQGQAAAAAMCLERAAGLGSGVAAFTAGGMYQHGEPPHIAKDEERAVALFAAAVKAPLAFPQHFFLVSAVTHWEPSSPSTMNERRLGSPRVRTCVRTCVRMV